MDPVLTYLNRISGMLAVQGYVDDTTMVGDTTAGYAMAFRCLEYMHPT